MSRVNGRIHLTNECYCGAVGRGLYRLTIECPICGTSFCAKCVDYVSDNRIGEALFKCPLCGDDLNLNHEEVFDDELYNMVWQDSYDFYYDEDKEPDLALTEDEEDYVPEDS